MKYIVRVKEDDCDSYVGPFDTEEAAEEHAEKEQAIRVAREREELEVPEDFSDDDFDKCAEVFPLYEPAAEEPPT